MEKIFNQIAYICGFHFFIYFFILPLFNQVNRLRTGSHLQPRPGQDKAQGTRRHEITHDIPTFKYTVINIEDIRIQLKSTGHCIKIQIKKNVKWQCKRNGSRMIV